MGALRTVACPACEAPRRTKALGRVKLSCPACGATYLASAAAEVTPPDTHAAPGPAATAQATPSTPPARPATPAAPAGGVTVLPFTETRMAPPASAPAVPAEGAGPVDEDPAGPAPDHDDDQADDDPPPPGPSRAGHPARGYYGRVGARRG
ncbi:MAG TPA: hypothetical protein VFP61_07655 [Acidimicrobiales bacterium]|nr:hypothetical protein [Acidimicrobiales bacterium]